MEEIIRGVLEDYLGEQVKPEALDRMATDIAESLAVGAP